MTKVEFVNAEVLRVAPDEVLIISLPGDLPEIPDLDDPFSFVNQIADILENVGLKDRFVLLVGTKAEFATVTKDEQA